ncbi:hypothetical protein [Pseudomonas japonica]|uniref:hypothetical protein n=1 Tax=Pseudomonas japonica TaxID=256466 RepID=UPI0015E2E987|nr:hypothetical protein [Pseudomonas japonica]MBA1287411.1 hypothetical protein [Pseudomonas japonica]
MLRRLACRTAGRMPGNCTLDTGGTSASMFTLPLLVIALALVGLGFATANALEVVIGAICLVAALSKPHQGEAH